MHVAIIILLFFLLAIPPEAGFMGIVTLQDVLESVLQERIYDEEDVAQRHLAGAGTLLSIITCSFYCSSIS